MERCVPSIHRHRLFRVAFEIASKQRKIFLLFLIHSIDWNAECTHQLWEMLHMLQIKRISARPSLPWSYSYMRKRFCCQRDGLRSAPEQRKRSLEATTRKGVEWTPATTKYFIKYFWRNVQLQISTWIRMHAVCAPHCTAPSPLQQMNDVNGDCLLFTRTASVDSDWILSGAERARCWMLCVLTAHLDLCRTWF